MEEESDFGMICGQEDGLRGLFLTVLRSPLGKTWSLVALSVRQWIGIFICRDQIVKWRWRKLKGYLLNTITLYVDKEDERSWKAGKSKRFSVASSSRV